jgi:hypothetical protein
LVVEAGAWLLREGLSPNTFQKERTEREKREISIEHSWNRRKPVSYTYSHEIIAFFSLIMIPSAAVTVAIPVAIVVLGRPLVPVRSRLLVPSLSPSRRTTSSTTDQPQLPKLAHQVQSSPLPHEPIGRLPPLARLAHDPSDPLLHPRVLDRRLDCLLDLLGGERDDISEETPSLGGRLERIRPEVVDRGEVLGGESKGRVAARGRGRRLRSRAKAGIFAALGWGKVCRTRLVLGPEGGEKVLVLRLLTRLFGGELVGWGGRGGAGGEGVGGGVVAEASRTADALGGD